MDMDLLLPFILTAVVCLVFVIALALLTVWQTVYFWDNMRQIMWMIVNAE